MGDYIVLAVVVIIVAAAIIYLVKQKKKGAKCIGCPYCGSCPSNKSGGSGCDNNQTK